MVMKQKLGGGREENFIEECREICRKLDKNNEMKKVDSE